MAIALPTSLQADLRVWRRAGWPMWSRLLMTPVLLLLACVAIACGTLYAGSGWCIAASGVLAFAGGQALMRGGLTNVLMRARFGWCAALPADPRVTTRVTLGLTGVALLAAIVAGTLLLGLVAIAAPHREATGLAATALDCGLVIGTLVAVWLVLREDGVVRMRHADGIREPLLALPWLNDARLPHLLDWQRRATLVNWRRGGSLAIVGSVLLLVPMGALISAVVALVLVTASLVWLGVAMRASAEVTLMAVRLLQATPGVAGRLRPVALRYPLVALACALILALAAVILVHAGPLAVVAWCLCAIAVSSWPFHRIFVATRRRGNAS
ncbi:MAG: hypothetical protein KGJ94_03725 [Xanthomonadaceae bacterium]|nr:hypothetical protein [Xanthomonadaceae bacterium]